MRAFNRAAVVAAATIAVVVPIGAATAAASPFAGLGTGSLGSLSAGTEDPDTDDPSTPTPAVSVSKASGLTDGETLTVTGTGFATDGPGIYVGIVQDSLFSTTDAGTWNTTTWIRPTAIVDGTWSTDITVTATKGAANCYTHACSVYTIAAHGSTDRSQDTVTPITFAPLAATPTVTISKTAGLSDGEDITVTGSGFGSDGQGVYVGLAQDDKYSTSSMSAFNAAAWVRAADIVDGGFTTTLKATAVKADADCYTNACSIFTFADRYSPDDRSQDTVTPITFAPLAAAPTVTVSKASGLTDGETLTVTGTGFATDGPGIYVGIVQDSLFSTTDAGTWNTTTWIRPTAIVDGTWSTDITVTATKGAANCYTHACSVYTIAAHGSTDRSQDTVTPITFAPLAANTLVDAPAIENTAGVVADADSGLPTVPLVVGGVIAAGLAVTALRRRA